MAEAKKLPLNEIGEQANRLHRAVYMARIPLVQSYDKKGIFTVPFPWSGGASYAAMKRTVDGYKQCASSLPAKPPVDANEQDSYKQAKDSVIALGNTIRFTAWEASDRFVYESRRAAMDAIRLIRAVKTPDAAVLKEVGKKQSYIKGLMSAVQTMKGFVEDAGVMDNWALPSMNRAMLP